MNEAVVLFAKLLKESDMNKRSINMLAKNQDVIVKAMKNFSKSISLYSFAGLGLCWLLCDLNKRQVKQAQKIKDLQEHLDALDLRLDPIKDEENYCSEVDLG